jgi:hypothetical protein
MIRTLPPDEKVAKFPAYPALVIFDKCGTYGMLRPCLIHPVAPLLSFLAPLFRSFFSPVHGVRGAAGLRIKALKS